MKKIFSTFLVLSLILLCGCTQYNGYIGPIFGSWSLTEITENGVPIDMEDETVFSFQNELVRVVRHVNPPYSYVSKYGNFTLSDNVLTLKFQTKETAPDKMYLIPDWLHFPQDNPNIQFKVDKLDGSRMKLTLLSDGKTYGYSFRKTW